MIVLRRPEFVGIFDRGDDRLVDAGLRARDRFIGLLFLHIVGREDRRAILRADVVALAVELGRIVRREEDVEQVAVIELRGVEADADRLGVPGIATAYLLVGRVGD